MKLIPKHHNQEILKQIDEYYYNYDTYDYDQYDSYYTGDWDDNFYDDYDPNQPYLEYVWLVSQDRVVSNTHISSIDGCNFYEDEDDTQDYDLYLIGGHHKLITFFRLIIEVMKNVDYPTPRLKHIYNTLIDRYPDLYLKLC